MVTIVAPTSRREKRVVRGIVESVECRATPTKRGRLKHPRATDASKNGGREVLVD